MPDKNELEISVEVLSVAYPKGDADEGGHTFRIIRTSRGVCKGKIGWRPTQGERLTLSAVGRGDGWGVSKYNGMPEFSFTSVKHDFPVDERGMLDYACQLTRGIGEVTRDKIWAAKGANWRTLALGDVPGVSSETLCAFQDTIQRLSIQREKSEAIAFVIGLGCTATMAEAAWEKWQGATIAQVNANCYCLADLPHFSFAQVDARISPRFNIGLDDTRRVEAAIRYCANQLSQSSTVFTWSALRDAVFKAAKGASPAVVATCVKAMFGSNALMPFRESASMALYKAYRAEYDIYLFAGGASCN